MMMSYKIISKLIVYSEGSVVTVLTGIQRLWIQYSAELGFGTESESSKTVKGAESNQIRIRVRCSLNFNSRLECTRLMASH